MTGVVSPIQYVSDDGTTYQAYMDKTNATAMGGVDAAGTEPQLRIGYDMRHVYVEYTDAATPPKTHRRKLWAPDPTDDKWTGVASTLSMKLYEGDAAAVTWSIRGRIGERRRVR